MHATLLFLSLCGLAFSGYLAGVRFFSETCAFNESCPLFLGYPTCYYGFAMFVVLTIASGALWYGALEVERAQHIISMVSVLGILFAGYFTFRESSVLFSEGVRAFALGLPTCAWGLFAYVAIYITSARL